MFQKELSCKSRVLERKFRCSVDHLREFEGMASAIDLAWRGERRGGGQPPQGLVTHGTAWEVRQREGPPIPSSALLPSQLHLLGSPAPPKEGIQEKQGRGREDGMRLGLRWGAGMENGLHPDPGRHEIAR